MRSGRGSVAPAAPWPLLSDALRERGYDIMLGIVSCSPLIAFRNVAVTPMIRKSHTMPPNVKKNAAEPLIFNVYRTDVINRLRMA